MTAKIAGNATSGIPLQDSLRERIQFLSIQEERARQERMILERALSDLLYMETSLSTSAIEEKSSFPSSSHLPEGNNKTVIASILRATGKPLRVTKIAQNAFENGLIQSAKGLEGVYSIVQTVLNRNSKTIFIKRDRGVWDLRERHSKQLDQRQDEEKSQSIPSLAESANGISASHNQPESAITDLTPSDAIVFALKKSKRGLTPGEIREFLDRAGYPKERWGKAGGYFYAVLKRLADDRKDTKILKRKKKYSALQEEHMQAKTNNTDDIPSGVE